ncbi:monothiol glutaredoxin grx4 [Xylographa parallela]|nr:monothiol glutaredoxin grx4 [Xylographa parallela]
MSQISEINSPEAFEKHLACIPSTALVVISFHTPWAAPCAQMSSILAALAANYPPKSPPSIFFMSLNAESLPDISESYDVTAVPYLVLQSDGKVLERISGCDAGKVRSAVERWMGNTGVREGKTNLPEALVTQPRPDISDGVNGGTSDGTNENPNTIKDLSTYAPSASDPPTAPAMSGHAGETEALHSRLAELVKAAPVMLFMKGTPSSPQCGFSRQLVGILREQGVRYGFFNILADEEVRHGMKVWADWPTFPQLWVGGELIGGLDIVRLGSYYLSLVAFTIQMADTSQVKEEIESNTDFFKDYAVEKGKGGMAGPEAQKSPGATAA